MLAGSWEGTCSLHGCGFFVGEVSCVACKQLLCPLSKVDASEPVSRFRVLAIIPSLLLVHVVVGWGKDWNCFSETFCQFRNPIEGFCIQHCYLVLCASILLFYTCNVLGTPSLVGFAEISVRTIHSHLALQDRVIFLGIVLLTLTPSHFFAKPPFLLSGRAMQIAFPVHQFLEFVMRALRGGPLCRCSSWYLCPLVHSMNLGPI